MGASSHGQKGADAPTYLRFSTPKYPLLSKKFKNEVNEVQWGKANIHNSKGIERKDGQVKLEIFKITHILAMFD